jgi:hypothetical protein
MTLDYHKVWKTMNELESVTSKICSAREILDSAIDALENHKLEKTEILMYAVDEYLQYYLEEFDRKFKDAWNETVVKLNQDETDAWDAVNKEKEYYEPSMPPWGHSDMESLSQQKEDKVVKWSLPVEVDSDGEYFITFPDDLLEAANLSPGEEVEWVEKEVGTFLLRKITKPLGMGEC